MKYLEEGDVIQIEEGMTVYANVPAHYLNSNRKGDFTIEHGTVEVTGELVYLAGNYIVTKTTFDGGGTGHGAHDVYPDGHHVFCESEDGINKIDFYQSGCFTAMHETIRPVGRAVKKWVIEDNDPT